MLKVAVLLCFLSLFWLAFVGKLEALELARKTGFAALNFSPAALTSKRPARWVGGGSVMSATSDDPSSRKTGDEADHAKLDGNSLYQAKPTVIRISFEEATQYVELAGWEDGWFSSGIYDVERYGQLAEPKIDFVYNWVNGSDDAFKDARHPYELESPLNDPQGKWVAQHSVNRYRDWDELRYSLRSLDAYARGFINKIQILVNSVADASGALVPQRPTWLKDDEETQTHVQVLAQESFFGEEERACLPTFNSLSIESQIHRTPSTTDRLVALSDDMFLGMPHTASDFFSPLFGSTMAFKSDYYNVQALGSKDKWPTFGEKPFLYYSSYLLNHRFGQRNRQVQAHFGHSVSRSVMKEALASFPQPSAKGVCEKFRGKSHFQIYS